MLAIIQNIEDDEDRAFVDRIYKEYEKQLYVLSMSVLHDHYEAQDCVHDTIEKIIETVEKYKGAKDVKHLRKMVTVTCRNCAINRFNKRKNRNKHEISIERYNYEENEYESVDILDYDSFVDRLVISEESCNALCVLLNKLDRKYRDVVLYKSLGFDDSQIAFVMNITVSLVRTRYYRAKKLLWEMGGKDLYVE